MQPTIVTIHGPRGERWEKLLGTRSFQVLGPAPVPCTLPGFDIPQPCYLLDVASLTDAQVRKLAATLSQQFRELPDQVLAEIQEHGVPILAEGCSVQFDLRLI